MKPLHLFLAVAVCTAPSGARAAGLFSSQVPPGHIPSVFRPVTSVRTVFRAQSDGVPVPPGADTGTGSSGSIVAPSGSGSTNLGIPSTGGQLESGTIYGTPTYPDSTWNAFSPPMTSDPFVTGPQMTQPYGAVPYGPMPGYNPAPFSVYGANGPTPFREGYRNSLDLEWMPGQSARGASGDFEQFGVDYSLAHTGRISPGWMLTWDNQFRMRNWEGPIGAPGIAGKAYRFGWDFELNSTQPGPVNIRLGFSPSINTDFNRSLASPAYQIDARGMFIIQTAPNWTVVLGAGFWNRVVDRVVPYAGVVYRDDYWDVRLMYPETTISVFLGNEPQWAKWAYIRVENHVEAYDMEIAPGGIAGGGSDVVEFNDWRAMFGFRMDGGLYSWFIEGGVVFDREVEYQRSGPSNFSPESGLLARMGWRY